ncbi:hypothetical protein [Butyrivibrio sp. MC2013]|uniref:hypothetical protein n=1 Tax=Butyrivibrio sp. MC2013 TaxID=1280686 RepID=UPI000406313B|nr:hypothetical protein [Butyrivibrio sp. MC2013]
MKKENVFKRIIKCLKKRSDIFVVLKWTLIASVVMYGVISINNVVSPRINLCKYCDEKRLRGKEYCEEHQALYDRIAELDKEIARSLKMAELSHRASEERYKKLKAEFGNSSKYKASGKITSSYKKSGKGSSSSYSGSRSSSASSSGSKASTGSKSASSKKFDLYDVYDYNNATDFANDRYEDFFEFEDDYEDEDDAYDAAVDYWNENH